MHEQLNAYRNEEEPDQETFERICQTLQQIALEEIGQQLDAPTETTPLTSTPAPAEETSVEEEPAASTSEGQLKVALINVDDKDRVLLVEELEQLGDIQSQSGDDKRYEVILSGSVSADDIEAVMCFIIEPNQIDIQPIAASEASLKRPRLPRRQLNRKHLTQRLKPSRRRQPKRLAAMNRPRAKPRKLLPSRRPFAYRWIKLTRLSIWSAS